MANPENLKVVRTPKQRRENARKAGIASGEARRKKRDLKECLMAILDGVSDDGGSWKEQIATALLTEAKKGNVRAFAEIRDTLYGKPVSTVEMTGKDGTPLQPPTFTIVAHE